MKILNYCAFVLAMLNITACINTRTNDSPDLQDFVTVKGIQF